MIDLIDRDELLKALKKEFRQNEYKHDPYFKFKKIVETMPTISSIEQIIKEPKTGRWIAVTDELWSGGGYWKCSNCSFGFSIGAYHEANEWNYCPHCGARMDGESDD